MKNKIAAIVVTYNRLNMLKENIDSLKKQTEQNYDILLISFRLHGLTGLAVRTYC